jgi:hypothetical protein
LTAAAAGSAGHRPDRRRVAILQWREGLPALDSAPLIAHLHAVGLAAKVAQGLGPGRCGSARDMSLEAARRVGRESFDELVIGSRLARGRAAACRAFPETPRRGGAEEAARGSAARGSAE